MHVLKNIRTSALFLFLMGAAIAVYGFFYDLMHSEQKVAQAEGKQCDLDQIESATTELKNENAHLFVSCGGFLE